VHQVTAADGTEWSDRHEPDEQRRESVGAEKNKFLNDVRPEQEQRSKVANEPKDAGNQQLDGERVQVAQDVPPRTVAACVAADSEKLGVLVVNLGWVNAETVKDGSLKESLRFIAPLRQHHKQRSQHKQPHHVKDECLAREAVKNQENRPDDEQHESDDAQQLVQLGALLQERRKETFK